MKVVRREINMSSLYWRTKWIVKQCENQLAPLVENLPANAGDIGAASSLS